MSGAYSDRWLEGAGRSGEGKDDPSEAIVETSYVADAFGHVRLGHSRSQTRIVKGRGDVWLT